MSDILLEMASTIKVLVSRKKKRYKGDGFNLDLTYILKNIIAMGYPAAKLEGVYRNHINDVYKFLETKHKDHYKIYNLCSERSYDVKRFHDRVSVFPFDDHNPPELELIQPFCKDVDEWLAKDPQNVAVVHCKAGKGRTGLMICCYILHCGLYGTANEALEYYGQTRTHDTKGVTIPSQRRYVDYYDQLLKSGLEYCPPPLVLHELHLEPVPNFSGGCVPVLTVFAAKSQVTPTIEVTKENGVLRMTLNPPLILQGDIRMTLKNKPNVMLIKEKMFHFWFNTLFVKEHRVLPSFSPKVNKNKKTDAFDESLSSLTKTAGLAFRADHLLERSDRSLSCTTANRSPNLFSPNSRASSLNSVSTDGSMASDQVDWLTLTLTKQELDRANKDNHHRIFDSDFKVTLYLTRPSADEHSGGLAVVPSKLNCLTSSTTSASSPSSPCFTTNGPSNGSKRRQKAAEPVAIHTVLTSSSKDSGSPRNLRFLGPVCWRPVSSDPPSCHPEGILGDFGKCLDMSDQPLRNSDSSTWSSEENDSSDVDTVDGVDTVDTSTAAHQSEQLKGEGDEEEQVCLYV